MNIQNVPSATKRIPKNRPKLFKLRLLSKMLTKKLPSGDQKYNYRFVGWVTYWITKGVAVIEQSVLSQNKATPYNCLHNCVSYFPLIRTYFPSTACSFPVCNSQGNTILHTWINWPCKLQCLHAKVARWRYC